MMYTEHKESRFSKKVDKLFWLSIMLMPLIIYLVVNFNSHYVWNYNDFLTMFRFDFIADILDNIFELAFDQTLPETLTALLSYAVAVEIAHVIFDVIVFIPRFAHKLIEKAVSYD